MVKGISRILKTNRGIFGSSILYSGTLNCSRILYRQYHLSLLKCASYNYLSCRFFSISNLLLMDFEQEVKGFKDKYLNMGLEEKRSQYRCKSKYVTLKKIPPWSEYFNKVHAVNTSNDYPKDQNLNKKVSILVADITSLEIDAIVNAANESLRGGGGVDGAIHSAAGPKLLSECSTLKGCPTGEAKITGGYQLPAKYVIHTVGPIGEKTDLLRSCYENSLNLAKENGLRTIAFPCISTGVYRYPNESAAHVALKTVRRFLEQNGTCMDRVIFCLFLPVDIQIYEALMQEYFPL